MGSGGYEYVSEVVFGQIDIANFLMEYDTARAGDFSPLRFVKDKGVVLGLVSSKTPTLESIADLKRRTEEAARYIDLERLAIIIGIGQPVISLRRFGQKCRRDRAALVA